jgi:hypothetical protein
VSLGARREYHARSPSTRLRSIRPARTSLGGGASLCSAPATVQARFACDLAALGGLYHAEVACQTADQGVTPLHRRSGGRGERRQRSPEDKEVEEVAQSTSRSCPTTPPARFALVPPSMGHCLSRRRDPLTQRTVRGSRRSGSWSLQPLFMLLFSVCVRPSFPIVRAATAPADAPLLPSSCVREGHVAARLTTLTRYRAATSWAPELDTSTLACHTHLRPRSRAQRQICCTPLLRSS